MDSDNGNPRVKRLTASIHVVRIGPFSLTRRMLRQLDQVRWDELEPFGRISAAYSSVPEGVGRHRQTGTLVRARWYYNPGGIKTDCCPDLGPLSDWWYGDDRPQEEGPPEWHPERGHWTLSGLTDWWRRIQTDAKPEHFDSLPLIILGGPVR